MLQDLKAMQEQYSALQKAVKESQDAGKASARLREEVAAQRLAYPESAAAPQVTEKESLTDKVSAKAIEEKLAAEEDRVFVDGIATSGVV